MNSAVATNLQLRAGRRPEKLKVTLSVTDGTTVTNLPLSVGRAMIATSKTFGGFEAKDLNKFKFTNGFIEWAVVPQGEIPRFTPSDVRSALLSLVVNSGDPAGTLTITGQYTYKYEKYIWDGSKWVKEPDPSKKQETRETGSAIVNVEPTGALHPVLAQTLDRLIYDQADKLVYRRYTVMMETGTPVNALSLEDLCTATAAGKDPYGWAALRALGLAVGLRIYDGDTSSFLKPEDLLKRVQIVFDAALKDYALSNLGFPFADIMLRPGADRVLGEFDAFDAPTRDAVMFDDHGLAFVQIALRPKALQAFRYGRLAMRWKKVPVAPEGSTLTELSLIIKIQGAAAVSLSLLRPYDNRSVEAGDVNPVFELPLASISQAAGENPWLTLLLRYPEGGTFTLPTSNLPDWIQLTANLTASEYLELVSAQEFTNPLDTDQKGVDVYERFPEIQSQPDKDAKPSAPWDWSKVFLNSDPAKNSLTYFVRRAGRISDKFVVPAGFLPAKTLTADDLKFLSQYIGWAQRFLDHASLPLSGDVVAAYSLSAPIRQQPWKLAAGHEGQVTLSFIHQDSLAHARAYAVRPIGRYHEFAAGGNIAARDQLEKLIADRVPQNLGYGVAVAERTQRLEAPVILGTERVDPDGKPGEDWQLVVARHPEQDLIASNRALFAKLGFEGVALSLVRNYDTPWWPERFKGDQPVYDVIPALPPSTADLDETVGFESTTLATLVDRYPDLWKGADVYRFRHLPHHMRVTVLAAARAGVIVSPISTVTQRDFHYRLPAGLKSHLTFDPTTGAIVTADIEAPRWSLQRIDGHLCLVVDFHLLSYADLMADATFKTWVAPGNEISHWPDPGVVYVLVRQSPAQKFEEEEAEVQMIPQPEGSTAVVAPYFLRARGPSLEPYSIGDPVHLPDPVGETPNFHLQARLQWKQTTPPRSNSADCTDQEAKAFADAIKDFGEMSVQVKLTATLPGGPDDPVDKNQATDLHDRLNAAWTALPNKPEAASVRAALKTQIDALQVLVNLTTPKPADAAALRKPLILSFRWPNADIPANGGGLIVETKGWHMTVNQLPSDDQMDAARNTGLATLFLVLKKLVMELVLEGAECFALRAVKGRNLPETRTIDGPDWSH